jgi:hypothetical protein
MTIETLAEKYRLKITRDECNDKIIQGRRGQLYVDAGQACCLWLNTRPILKATLAPLGGKLWMGDVSEDERGKRLQDIRVQGIRPEQVPLAIRLCGIKRRREMSEAQRAHAVEALAKAHKKQEAAP